MLAILAIPFGYARGLVHVFDDLSPADTRVVGTERDFSQLGCIRDDAHLGAAEVIVEQILEPHTGNKQEIPRIIPALFDVFNRTVARDLTVALPAQTK